MNALRTVEAALRQAFSTLTQTWSVGVLSVVLAIALWVFVTDRENPDVTGTVPGTIPIEAVNVPADQAVFSTAPEFVRVRVRAPENVFDDLHPEDFTATVDLSGVSSQQATLAVRVESDKSRVEVLEVSPAQVAVRLEAVTSRVLPVEANLIGTPPRGFQASEFTFQPAEVVVVGPTSLVDDKVATIDADISLTGVRANFTETVLLHARDQNGGSIVGVNIEPESVVVNVDIVQLEFSRVFVVIPEIDGTPAAGFAAKAIQVEPSFVVVSGPAEVFQNLDPLLGIHTDPVSIDGASDDVVRPVALQLPPGARVEQAQVTVRVTIGALTPASGGPSP
jgi:YbbR domain-containing protein